MQIVWPVMAAPPLPARNKTVAATSAGVASRPSGGGPATTLPDGAGPGALAAPAVATAPGKMAFTVIPSPLNSSAALRVNALTAAFDALYAASPA